MSAMGNLISVEDYLAGELVSPAKHEYLGGIVYARGPVRGTCTTSSRATCLAPCTRGSGESLPAVRFGHQGPHSPAEPGAFLLPRRVGDLPAEPAQRHVPGRAGRALRGGVALDPPPRRGRKEGRLPDHPIPGRLRAPGAGDGRRGAVPPHGPGLCPRKCTSDLQQSCRWARSAPPCLSPRFTTPSSLLPRWKRMLRGRSMKTTFLVGMIGFLICLGVVLVSVLLPIVHGPHASWREAALGIVPGAIGASSFS